ncbi:MAG TPA: hypothetical protein VIN58_10815 [Roseateles sp.]
MPLPAERERCWQTAQAADDRISPTFRARCADNAAALERAMALA